MSAPNASREAKARLRGGTSIGITSDGVLDMGNRSCVKDQRGLAEPEHVEAGVAIPTADGNKERK